MFLGRPKIPQRWGRDTIRRKGGGNAISRVSVPIPQFLVNLSTLTNNASYLPGANTNKYDAYYYNLYAVIRA